MTNLEDRTVSAYSISRTFVCDLTHCLTFGEVMSLRESKEELAGGGLVGGEEGRDDIIILHNLKKIKEN